LTSFFRAGALAVEVVPDALTELAECSDFVFDALVVTVAFLVLLASDPAATAVVLRLAAVLPTAGALAGAVAATAFPALADFALVVLAALEAVAAFTGLVAADSMETAAVARLPVVLLLAGALPAGLAETAGFFVVAVFVTATAFFFDWLASVVFTADMRSPSVELTTG